MKLFKHQQDILDADPLWTGLFLGTGSGKTFLALSLAKGTTLVVCEKQGRDDQTFEKNKIRFGINLPMKVVSKEDFRKNWGEYGYFDTVIIDESDNFCGILPDTVQKNGIQVPKMSQMHEALYDYIQLHKPKRFYLLSATPASKPMHVYAIARLFGKTWDYYKFRETFYTPVKKGWRQLWLPNKTKAVKERLAVALKKMGYFGQLSDFFDVPDQTFHEVFVCMTKSQVDAMKKLKSEEADPMAIRAQQRAIENGVRYGKAIQPVSKTVDRLVKTEEYFESEKIKYILKYSQEFPKLLIFSDYLGQIRQIEKALTDEGYTVLLLTGATKDRKSVMERAERENCIVIASSKISAGYEWKSCPTVIFASKSYRCRDYIQSLGRVQRSDAIKKNLYISLVVKDGLDHACHKTVLEGEDFHERIMSED